MIEERKKIIISGKAANSSSNMDQTRRYLMAFRKAEKGQASAVSIRCTLLSLCPLSNSKKQQDI